MKPDGTLDWQAPEGRWTVCVLATPPPAFPTIRRPRKAPATKSTKWIRPAVDRAFNNALGRVMKEAGPLKGTAFTSILTDSWEAGQQNWCIDFPAQFQKRRGYDMTPYLPVLAGRVVGSQAESEAFLIHFRRTCGDLIAENYFGEMTKLAGPMTSATTPSATSTRAFNSSSRRAIPTST